MEVVSMNERVDVKDLYFESFWQKHFDKEAARKVWHKLNLDRCLNELDAVFTPHGAANKLASVTVIER
jgi:hypothetical protein